jgi:hypothetical protein
VAGPVATLDYERGPQLGLVAIDETADGGVCVRVAPHPLRIRQVVSAALLWTMTALAVFTVAKLVTLRESRPLARLGDWFICAGVIGAAAWAMWPRRFPLTVLLATSWGVQYTRGSRHRELHRSRVRRVATCISPPKLAWTLPVSVVVYFDNGGEWVVWSGGRDEGCTIAAALRRGLGIPEEND